MSSGGSGLLIVTGVHSVLNRFRYVDVKSHKALFVIDSFVLPKDAYPNGTWPVKPAHIKNWI